MELHYPWISGPLRISWTYFCANFGGEKLLKFVEKCRWNIFKRPERGYKFFGRVSDHFSNPFSPFFKPFFVSILKFFGGSFVLQTCRPKFYACFAVLGAADAPAPELDPGAPEGSALAPAFASGSLRANSWIWCIYIYMLWCYYLGQVWPFEVLLSGPSLFFTKRCLSNNTVKIGVSALFVLKKNCARKFEVLLSGPSWPFLSCSQLGPDNNTYLAQIITPQNGFFSIVCFKNVLKYLFL